MSLILAKRPLISLLRDIKNGRQIFDKEVNGHFHLKKSVVFLRLEIYKEVLNAIIIRNI